MAILILLRKGTGSVLEMPEDRTENGYESRDLSDGQT